MESLKMPSYKDFVLENMEVEKVNEAKKGNYSIDLYLRLYDIESVESLLREFYMIMEDFKLKITNFDPEKGGESANITFEGDKENLEKFYKSEWCDTYLEYPEGDEGYEEFENLLKKK